jgi:hypothetical protein
VNNTHQAINPGRRRAPDQRELTRGDDHYQLRTSDRMTIVPASDPPGSAPPGLLIDAMSRADACPDCCTNVETPYRIEIESHDRFTGFYGCNSCGWFWHTGWTF